MSGGDSEPTRDALASRAETAAEALRNGDWAKVYDLFIPSSKAVCDVSESAALASMGYLALHSRMGLEESQRPDFQVGEVAVIGPNGKVTMHLYLDDYLYKQGRPEIWTYFDNNWWIVNEPEDCSFGRSYFGGWVVGEMEAIRNAIETMMSENNMTTVNTASGWSFISDSFDFDPSPETQTLLGYIREPKSKYCYTWDSSGRITKQRETISPDKCQ